MKDTEHEEGCQGVSWLISVDKANELHDAVIADQQLTTPIPYNLACRYTLLGPSSSQARGHNCFTWAREKVLDLKSARYCSG